MSVEETINFSQKSLSDPTASLNIVLCLRTSFLPTDLGKLIFSSLLPILWQTSKFPHKATTEAAEMIVCTALWLDSWKSLKFKIKLHRKCLTRILYIMHYYNRALSKEQSIPTHPAVSPWAICFPCLRSISCKVRLTKWSPVEFHSTARST